MIGAYFVLTANFKKEYPPFPEIVCGFALLFFGLFCLFYYLNRRTIYVFSDRFALKSGLFSVNVEIRYDEIQSWAEIQKTTKNRNWDELLLFTSKGKFRFCSYNYFGYSILKSQITKGKTRNLDYEKKWNIKNISLFSFFFLFFGTVFLAWGGYYFLTTATISSTDFVKIEQIITSEIKTKRNGKHSRCFEFKFNDYPEFSFNIKGNSYHAMHVEDFLADVSLGDTLIVSIPKNDFEKKISKTKPLTFWDKSFDYYDIPIVTVSHTGKKYLNLNDVAKERKSNRKSNAWILITFGGILLAIGLFIFIKRKKIAEAK